MHSHHAITLTWGDSK